MAKAGAKMDEHFEGRLLDLEDVLRRSGATQSEIEETLQVQRTMWADTRVIILDDLAGQISRDGQNLN